MTIHMAVYVYFMLILHYISYMPLLRGSASSEEVFEMSSSSTSTRSINNKRYYPSREGFPPPSFRGKSCTIHEKGRLNCIRRMITHQEVTWMSRPWWPWWDSNPWPMSSRIGVYSITYNQGAPLCESYTTLCGRRHNPSLRDNTFYCWGIESVFPMTTLGRLFPKELIPPSIAMLTNNYKL